MKKELLYEGKAKRIYATDDAESYVQEFKNDATAFNGLKKSSIEDKGKLNTEISSAIFTYLEQHGIRTHFIEKLSETEMLVKKVEIIKAEVVCRNKAAGSLVKRLGFTEGQELKQPIVEFYLKDDALGDPLFTEAHIYELGIANEQELVQIKEMTLKINTLLRKLFAKSGLELIDFKLEFGRTSDGEVILADEISPDTSRLWDVKTHEKLDKDRFRLDLGGVTEAYREVASRIKGGIS